MERKHHPEPVFSLPAGTAREALVLLALALLFAAGTAILHPKAPAWSEETPGEGEVTLEGIEAWDGDVLWVDARSRDAYETDHVPGAVLLNEDEWYDLFLDFSDRWIDLSQPRVVVYCDSRECQASHKVAERLREEMGTDNVYVLHGGWDTWREAAR